jgi:hypothetical protein
MNITLTSRQVDKIAALESTVGIRHLGYGIVAVSVVLDPDREDHVVQVLDADGNNVVMNRRVREEAGA